jgi:hypothetical protein
MGVIEASQQNVATTSINLLAFKKKAPIPYIHLFFEDINGFVNINLCYSKVMKQKFAKIITSLSSRDPINGRIFRGFLKEGPHWPQLSNTMVDTKLRCLKNLVPYIMLLGLVGLTGATLL